MATNIPPHNLREIVAAIIAPDRQSRRRRRGDLRKFIKGPDFPTGGYIYGREGIKDYQETGRGRIVMRARAVIEEKESLEQVADRRHRDPVPGQQRAAAREHRRAGARQEARGDQRPAERERPRRHAHRDRAEARRDPARRAQPALQAHAAADDVRRDHARARARPDDAAAGAEDHAAQGSARALHHAPPRSHRAPRAVRARQGARARAHPRGTQDRRRQHRRGDQDHPRARRTRRRRARSCRRGSS